MQVPGPLAATINYPLFNEKGIIQIFFTKSSLINLVPQSLIATCLQEFPIRTNDDSISATVFSPPPFIILQLIRYLSLSFFLINTSSRRRRPLSFIASGTVHRSEQTLILHYRLQLFSQQSKNYSL